jgi:hypothetical protein
LFVALGRAGGLVRSAAFCGAARPTPPAGLPPRPAKKIVCCNVQFVPFATDVDESAAVEFGWLLPSTQSIYGFFAISILSTTTVIGSTLSSDPEAPTTPTIPG